MGGGHIHELRMPRHIASRPDARVGCCKRLLDPDLALVSGLHAHRLEVQPVGHRAAPGGQQKLGGTKFLLAAGIRRDCRYLARGLIGSHGVDYGSANDADTLIGEDIHERQGSLGLLSGCQPGTHQHGHFRPKTREQLRLLKGDVSAADHQQRLGNLLKLHRGGGGIRIRRRDRRRQVNHPSGIAVH